MNAHTRPTKAEVSLDHLRYNLANFRAYLSPETKIMAVVKADAYGHGASEIANSALSWGADYLGVAIVEEGIALRKNGIKAPILVFGNPVEEHVPLLFQYNLIPTVISLEMAKKLSTEACKRGKILSLHVKVDTGMGRLGIFPPEKSTSFLEDLKSMPGLKVEGIYTHFATADETDKTYAKEQIKRFKGLLEILKEKNLCPPLKHAANSAAAIELPEAWLDMVRLGISMYGHYPSEDVEKSRISLKPLLTLKTRVTFIKEVPPKTPISYGCTYITKEKSKIASIPIGYGDGFNRLLSNKGNVLIKGKRVPIVGRVCMDQLLVNISRISGVREGDEVIVYGSQEEEKISVEEIAKSLGTINYEILCNVGSRVPREYFSKDHI